MSSENVTVAWELVHPLPEGHVLVDVSPMGSVSNELVIRGPLDGGVNVTYSAVGHSWPPADEENVYKHPYLSPNDKQDPKEAEEGEEVVGYENA